MQKQCPTCGLTTPAEDETCPHCNTRVDDSAALEATKMITAEPPPHSGSLSTIDAIPSRSKTIGTQPGDRFGDYLILGTIARGGMGVVFRARHTKLNREVALKMILASHLANNEDIQRFHAEAEAAARLNHSGIVPIYEVGELGGQHYFSMGLVEGGSLAELVKTAPVDPQRAAQIGKNIAEAVQYAHSRNIVHRDLKPANVLLDRDGRPCVTDFGLAKNIEQDSGLTASGQVMGTPGYMPPEQAAGRNEQVGPLADVYSLGAILYSLVTQQPPFRGRNVVETLRQVIEAEPVSPKQLNPRVDSDLTTIILKCLAKDPLRRYASAGELAQELGRYLAGMPILARPTSQGERIWRWCKRNPVISGLGLTAFAFLIATATLATIGYLRESKLTADLEGALQQQKSATEHATEQTRIAATERATAKLRLAEAYFDRALIMYDKGEIQTGLLFLAKSLRELPPDQALLSEDITRNIASWSDEIPAMPVLYFNHGSIATSATYFPNGRRIAVGCRDGSIVLWDLQSGAVQQTKMSHDNEIFRIAISPDGSKLMTGCLSGAAQLWNVSTEQPIGPAIRHAARVTAVGFTPNNQLAYTSSWDQSSRWFNSESGELVRQQQHMGWVLDLVANGDNQQMIASEAAAIAVREISTGNIVRQYAFAQQDGVAVSRDGKLLGLTGRENKLQVLNTETGQKIGESAPFTNWGTEVAFNAAGTRIACAARDLTVRLYDASSVRPVGTGLLHRATVEDLQFAPSNNSQFLTLSPGQLRVWSARTNSLEKIVPSRDRQVHTAMYAPRAPEAGGGHQIIAFSGQGTIQAHDTEDLKPLADPQQVSGVVGVAPSRDGSKLLLQYPNKVLRLFDRVTLKPLSAEVSIDRFPDPLAVPGKDHISGMSLHRDDDLFAVGKGYAASIWSLSQSKPMTSWLPHPHNVASLAFSPDGKVLATACQDGFIRYWDSTTGSQVGTVDCESGAIRSLKFNDDGSLIAIVGKSKVSSIWDVATSKRVAGPFESQDVSRILCWNPDSTLLAIGGGEWNDAGKFKHHLRLWSVKTSRPASRIYEVPHNLTDATFSPDGRSLLSTCEDGHLRLWKTPQPIPGDPEDIERWIELLTGMRLDERNVPQFIDASGADTRFERIRSSDLFSDLNSGLEVPRQK